MKTKSHSSFKLIGVLVASSTCVLAQTSEAYEGQTGPRAEMVRPGSLNYVEGAVSSNGQILTPQLVGHFALQPGQSLETGDGYAEVLLTPGAFLRVAPGSEITMPSVGLANTQVALNKGSAMVEADQLIKGTHLEVTVGRTSGNLLKRGLYQFSSLGSRIRVFDGQLSVAGLSAERKIGKGDQIAILSGDAAKKTNFDLNQAKEDPLYVWSQARSRDEANQNQQLAANYAGYSPVGGGWFWDPYVNYYGFWPASAYLYSPFGFRFYGGYYPGFYGRYPGIYSRGFYAGRVAGGVHAYSGFHGNGISGGFHGGGHR